MKKLGEYEIVRKIGQGAMGAVFEARMPVIGETVAIKVLSVGQIPADEREELRKRFVREASLLWKINHPHVIGIHHVGAVNGLPYFVMKYLPTTLKNKMGFGEETCGAKVRLEEREAVRIATCLLSALACLHDAGGVHRDVKPENILFTNQDEPKLADFGIAKWCDRNIKTQTGFAMGTTDYMAPEQCDAGKADCRADIYAVGIVVYEMLTGMHPFRTRFQDPSTLRPDIKKGWDDLFRKATEPSPQDRFQSAGEMALALENLVESKRRPGDIETVTLGKTGVRMEFAYIPPGEFMMGSPETEEGSCDDERPRHRVKIEKGFHMQTTPVTQGQWEAVMGSNPSWFENCGKDCPVEQVSWDDAKKFIEALNRISGKKRFRLPTEAEWEYACRAGTTTALYNGDMEILGLNNAPSLDPIAWYGGNSGVDYDGGYDSSGWDEKQYEHSKAGVHPVGRKLPNSWGLYDMIGNVFEWVEDDWHENYNGAPSGGSAWVDSPRSAGRVLRGGGWGCRAGFCRSAVRVRSEPGLRGGSVGLRLAALF